MSPASIDKLRLISVGEYHAMHAAGILLPDDTVELLEARIVKKMPRSPRHCAIVFVIQRLLNSLIPSGWLVLTQHPVTMTTSEPEPDVMVVRGEIGNYLEHHPGPEDVALVIEVAEGSSLRRDRIEKKRIYGLAKIKEYWIVNLLDSTLETYADPSIACRDDYKTQRVYRPGERLSISGQMIDAADLLEVR